MQMGGEQLFEMNTAQLSEMGAAQFFEMDTEQL